jgi:microcin C transport system substrate-binding protein
MTNRRTLLKLAGLAPFSSFSAARAAEPFFTHALSLFGDVKYKADFSHFDYVNPKAPKGGKVRQWALGSFDSLNPNSLKGTPAAVTVLESLMVDSLDEPATRYGLIAESVSHPDDVSSATFKLRAEAKFHDGQAITPEDVVWSFETLKANLPTRAEYYKNVIKAEKTGERLVTFTFDQKNNRELPSIVGQLVVMPKHWWTANGPDGKPRDVSASTLEIPLGSGPYKITSVNPSASIVMQRVKDYWGKDLAVNVGQNNFDEMTYTYFQTQLVAFEGFKGDQFDYNYESSSKNWATGYDFPAVKKGHVILDKIALKKVNGMQGWALNMRKAKFQDVRVRRAFDLAFDFEWANQNLFFGQYTRARSYFNHSEMEAKGLPSADELALLTPLKDQLPPEVFTTEYINPVNNDATARRKNLREAAKLLADAGYVATPEGGRSVLKNAKGETLAAEFLLYSPLFERIALPYKEQLELLGISITLRSIDVAQYQKRVESFDYDVIVGSFAQSLSPGNEQRFFFGSESADKNGSSNYVGIKNPAVDALIDKVIFAKDRASLVTACQALDRVLMWNHYMVPHWFSPYERVAYWNRFGRPEKTPDYNLGFPTLWWWDDAKAKQTAAG